MPRKRIPPQPVFTPEELERAKTDVEQGIAAAGNRERKPAPTLPPALERELEWSRAFSVTEREWDSIGPPQQTTWDALPERFKELFRKRVGRAGRPRGTDSETEEKARKEYELYSTGRTSKEIAQQLYPLADPETMESQIRQRRSRYKRRTTR